MSALIPFSEALRLDAELVRIGRGASASRLAVGIALDALASSSGYHELGFSSFEAYARERCARTGRWAADTRALARKLVAIGAVGPDIYIPATDLNTSSEMMDWFADEYIREQTRMGPLGKYGRLYALLSTDFPETSTPFTDTTSAMPSVGAKAACSCWATPAT